MTKKEVVSTLRKRFNNWCLGLPDVEYKSCNDHSEQILPDGWTNGLEVLELAAEVMNEEEAWLEQDATPNERKTT